MNSVRNLTLALALVSVWGAAAAGAQDVAPSPAQNQTTSESLDLEARELFNAGRIAFDDGRFEPALGYFTSAYELSERPELLFNIGAAADRLRRDQEALLAFRRYLVELPDASNRAEVQGRIAVLETTSQRVDSPPDPPDVAQPVEADRPTPEAANITVPVILMVAGGVVAIGGGVLLGVALSNKDEIESLMGDPRWSEYESQADSVPVLSTLGFAGMALGGAALLTGVILLSTGGESDEGSVQISVGPSGAVLRGQL